MTLIELPFAFVLPCLFVLGAVVGSFLNVAIYRIPRHENFWKSLYSVVHPPSSCPNCGNRILSQDNIPILGWFLLGGRCRFCRQSFSIRYPAIEFLNACLFVFVYWMEIPGNTGSFHESCLYVPSGPQGIIGSAWLSPNAVLLWRYIYHIILVEALLVATFIDFDLRIIPDGVTLPAMFVGVLGGLVVGQVHLVPVWFQNGDLSNFVALLYDIWGDGGTPPRWLSSLTDLWWMSGRGIPSWCAKYPHLHGLAVSLAGLVVGGGVVWIVRIIGQLVLKQEAMGFGDVVLMAMVGSFLGWQPTVMVFVLAPVLALLSVAGTWIVSRQREIPYGPYLSLAALVVIVSWKWLWVMFERVFELGPLLPFLAVGMALCLYLLLQITQFIKWCLGIKLYPPEWVEEWTSADQLAYQAMEQTDPQQGRWRRTQWSGSQSGTGRLHADDWRCSLDQQRPNGWQQQWQRRSDLK